MSVQQPLRAGQQLQTYTLLEELGRGGEAAVWSGWDKYEQRVVAVKLIPTMGTQPALISSDFERQVHLIASLSHPNILPLYEFGASTDYYFFVMRYASGGSLSDLLKQGAITTERALCITADMVAALEYLHGNRIVHRDLKPSNILLDAQGRAYLTDYGLARRLTEDTLPLHTGRGTTFYASPEQHSRSLLTAKSDIYSLGIVLYEMLTGSLPKTDESGEVALDQKTTADLPPLEGELVEVRTALLGKLHRLSAYDPDERPETVAAALDLLFADLPDEIVAGVRRTRRARQKIGDEDDLLREDARTLVDGFLGRWEQGQAHPATLTEIAYIDSAYTRPALDAGLPDEWLEFQLEGALLHGHNEARWWRRVPDPDVRLRVCERVLSSSKEDAVARVLSQMVDADEDGLSYRRLSGEAVEQLIDIAVQGGASAVRGNALTLLERRLPRVERWQPFAFSEEGDTKLARLAMRESPFARQAAELIGGARSEAAFRALLDAHQANPGDGQLLATLQTMRAAAGGLPPWTPLRVRFRSTFDQLREQFLEDQAVLSWSRALIGLLSAGIISAMMVLGLFTRANTQTHDILYQPYPVSGVVTIVEVNDETLAQYGRWSNWPRSLHAELIEALDEAGADVIALDFTFVSETPQDDELAEAIRQAGNVVQPILGQGDAYNSTSGLLEFRSGLWPQAELAAASAAMGHTNFRHDDDGYVRRLPLVVSLGDEPHPNLALAAIQTYLGGELDAPLDFEQTAVGGWVTFAGREIPVNEWREMLVHYAGPPAQPGAETFRMVSYEDVLAGEVPAEAFEDKIVLVGITATAEPDRYLTAVSDNGRPMYGVEILANAIETIWSGRFIRQPATWVRVAILLVLGVVVALLATRPWLGLLVSATVALLYFLLASWLFDFQGIILDLFFPFLTIALSYGIVTAYRFSVEARERHQILSLFEARVTPRVARATLTAVRQGRINLGGQAQEVSVLSASLRGYSFYAARHTPEEVLSMLNTYFGLLTEAIFEHEGTLIQASGDRVLAVFNAPLPQADHAMLAMQTAWEGRRRVNAYHRSLPEDHPHRRVDFTYGVATGKAVVGYTGAASRYGYTALGATVELAGRLVRAASPGEVLVSGASYRAADGHVTGELLNPVSSRRIAEPTPVFLLRSIRGEVDS